MVDPSGRPGTPGSPTACTRKYDIETARTGGGEGGGEKINKQNKAGNFGHGFQYYDVDRMINAAVSWRPVC